MDPYRLTVVGSYDGQVINNAWHVLSDGPPELAEVEAFMDATHEAWNGRVVAGMSLTHVVARRVDIVDTVGTIHVPTGWPLAGGAGAIQGLPGFAGVRIVGTGVSDTYPRSIRKWICGVREDDTVQGVLSAGALTSWQTALNALRTYIAGTPALVLVAAKYTEGDDPVVDATLPIDTVNALSVLGMQRRRRIGRGI